MLLLRMYSLKLTACLCLFLLKGIRSDSRNVMTPPSRENPSARMLVAAICEAIGSQYSEEGKTTFVFVLFATPEHRSLFNFLWKLPHAHVYLADPDFPLKQNDREIVISWERDNPDKKQYGNPINEYWEPRKGCGHSDCSKAKRNIQHLHLEKRALIQVREVKSADPAENFRIFKALSHMIGLKYYLRRYRSSFIVARVENIDVTFAAYTVRRSGRLVGEHVADIILKIFNISDAREVFLPALSPSNRTVRFSVGGFAVTFDGERDEQFRIILKSCFYVSTPLSFSTLISVKERFFYHLS